MMNDPRFAAVRPSVGGMYAAVTGRSFWPLKAAVMCGVTVAALPLLVGAIAGVAVGAVVYAIGSAVDGLIRAVTPGDGRRHDPAASVGRENVRVIHRP